MASRRDGRRAWARVGGRSLDGNGDFKVRFRADLALPGLQNGIISARFLRTGAAVEFDNAAKTITLPKDLPDDIMTTIGIELDGEPRIE